MNWRKVKSNLNGESKIDIMKWGGNLQIPASGCMLRRVAPLPGATAEEPRIAASSAQYIQCVG